MYDEVHTFCYVKCLIMNVCFRLITQKSCCLYEPALADIISSLVLCLLTWHEAAEGQGERITQAEA